MALFGPPDLKGLAEKKNISKLIKTLSYKDSGIRRDVARVLGDLGDKSAVVPLILALQDCDPSVRAAAAQALGMIGDPRAFEPLTEALKENDSDVRNSAVEALGKIRVDKTSTPMKEAPKDESPSVHSPKRSTLTFKDSPVGRAAKNALEHLLADHRNNEFTYTDFPPVPQEFLDYVADELKEASRTPGLAVANAENVEQWANSEIIGPLTREGYVEIVGYHTFVFTENGKSINNIELDIKEAPLDTKETPKDIALHSPAWQRNILRITEKYLSVQMIDINQIDEMGRGGQTYMKALSNWNSQNYDAAAQLYQQAIAERLTPVFEGAARNNLGQIFLEQKKLDEAIQQFLAILRFEQASYSSVNDAAQYLSIILVEIGRRDEAVPLQQLASRAQAILGYSLSQDAISDLRHLVGEWLNKNQ